jgi:hypothetical protein
MSMNYTYDADMLRNGPVIDPSLRFGSRRTARNSAQTPQLVL